MKIAIKLLLLACINSSIVAIQPCFTDKQLHEISADDILACLKSVNAARIENNIPDIKYNITKCGKLFIEGISTENKNTEPCDQDCTSSVNENFDAIGAQGANSSHVTIGFEMLQQITDSTPNNIAEAVNNLSEDLNKDQSQENPYADRQD